MYSRTLLLTPVCRTKTLFPKRLTRALTSSSLLSELADHWPPHMRCKATSSVCLFLTTYIRNTDLNYVIAVFIQVQTEQEAALFDSQASTMVTLTKGCKSLKVVRDIQQIPAGCGSTLLSQSVAVHILVRVSSPPYHSCLLCSCFKLRAWWTWMLKSPSATRSSRWRN